jgi:hypothetical protein
MKIIKCKFQYGDTSFSPHDVIATFEDGHEEKIFDFYSDEISFSTYELIGLTVQEARELRFQKDKAYLQS